MKWPKTENLSVKWWSIRVISSFKLVGAVTPLINCVPLVGAGKMPAFSRICALGSSKLVGMVLLGNACPGWSPAAANFASSEGANCDAEGTWMAGPPDILPPYQLVSGTVWLIGLPPWTYLRHSML